MFSIKTSLRAMHSSCEYNNVYKKSKWGKVIWWENSDVQVIQKCEIISNYSVTLLMFEETNAKSTKGLIDFVG